MLKELHDRTLNLNKYVLAILTSPVFFLTVVLFSLCSNLLFADIKFIPNKGQWETNAKFRAEIPGGFLYIFDNKIYYQFFQVENYHGHQAQIRFKNTEIPPSTALIQAVEVYFEGGNLPGFEPTNPTEETFNFFYGQDQTKWAGGLHGFKDLLLKNVYPGISLRLYFAKDHLKYDWCVEPGADASLIQLGYVGADSLSIQDGSLHIFFGKNKIVEEKPISFSEGSSKTKFQVPSRYELKRNLVSFIFPSGYDKSKKLTIDPKLIFSSYSGSFSDNFGNTATYDSSGNLYTGGTAYGGRFPIVPAVPGGFRQSLNGLSDVVLMKFSTDGTKLLFSTYLGGGDGETPHSMIVNKKNELIVMGSTSSRNFPVKNGYDITFNGGVGLDPLGYDYSRYNNGSDIFLIRFSGDGSSILSGTYLGGTNNDGVIQIGSPLCINYGDQFRGEVNLDNEDNVLVVSSTSSFNFPVNGFDKVFNNTTYEGILAKLNGDLSAMLWSTFLGGNYVSAGLGVSVDKSGTIYVCGGINTRGGEALLQKYSEQGVRLLSKQIGTTSYDQAYFVQADTIGNVFIFGQTSGSFPVSPGVYSNRGSGQFIQKYNANFDLLFSTVVGAGNTKNGGTIRPDISPTAFLVNECGMIYIAGWGGSFNKEKDFIGGDTRGMPIKGASGVGPAQSNTDGSDFYLMILDQDAKSLVYGTFFGGPDSGEHVDGGTSRFDPKGNVYECVCACFTRNGYPTTPGVVSNYNNTPAVEHGFQNVYPDCNNAAFKFNLGYLKASFDTYSSSNEGPGFKAGCAPLLLNIVNTSVGGQFFDWSFGDSKLFSGFTPGRYQYDSAGMYKLILVVKDDATCIKSDTASEVITVSDFTLKVEAKMQICKDSLDLLVAKPSSQDNKQYQWFLNRKLIGSNDSLKVSPEKESVYSLTVTDTVLHCVKKEELTVKVLDVQPEATVVVDSDCDGKTQVIFQTNDKDATNLQWNFGDGNFSAESKIIHNYIPGVYTVNLQLSNQYCQADTSFTIEVQNIFYPNMFTPNNDKLNDNFEVKGTVGNWKLKVYNRWGKQVANYENYHDQWNGANVEDGVYYILLTSPVNRECKGWVEIIR